MDNYVEYTATGKCNQFQNPFYTAQASDIVVKVNGIEEHNYTWLLGTKYVQLGYNPADGDRVRITNTAYVSNPDPDLEQMRNDVSANTQAIDALEAKDTSHDNSIATNTSAITTVDNRVTSTNTEVGNLDSRVASAENDISDNTSDIASLGNRVGQNETDIGNLSDQSSNISDLQSRMTGAENGIIDEHNTNVTQQIEIDGVQADLALMKAKYDHIAEGEREIKNNVTVAEDLTHGDGDIILVDADTEFSAYMDAEFQRETGSESRFTIVRYRLSYYSSQWHIFREQTTSPTDTADDGITLGVTNTGNQGTLKYLTDNMSGTNYTGTMRFKLYKMRNTI